MGEVLSQGLLILHKLVTRGLAADTLVPINPRRRFYPMMTLEAVDSQPWLPNRVLRAGRQALSLFPHLKFMHLLPLLIS